MALEGWADGVWKLWGWRVKGDLGNCSPAPGERGCGGRETTWGEQRLWLGGGGETGVAGQPGGRGGTCWDGPETHPWSNVEGALGRVRVGMQSQEKPAGNRLRKKGCTEQRRP